VKERPSTEMRPVALSMVMTSPAWHFSLVSESIIFCPKS